jgi:hypothetical protein
MTLRQQNIIFSLFLIAFIISAPLVVLLTAGYKYSFIRSRWEKTGVLQVDAVPSGATVRIDKLDIIRKTPATISRLAPDQQTVIVEKEGYTTWQKTIEIRSGQTTFVDRIVLFKNSTPSPILVDNIAAMNISEDGTIVAATQKEKQILLWKINNGDTTLLTTLPELPTTENISLSFSSDNTIIFVQTGNTIVFVPTYQPITPVILTREDCTSLQPLSSGDAVACLLENNQLITLSPQNEPLRASEIGDVLSLGKWDEKVVAITNEVQQNSLWEINKKNDDRITGIPKEIDSITASVNEALLLQDARHKNTLVVTAKSPSDYNLLPFPLLGITHEKNAPFVVWNSNEVYTLDSNTLTATLITRITSPILNAFSVGRGNAVVYTTTQSVQATEIDQRNNPLTTSLESEIMVSAAKHYINDLYFISNDPKKPGLFTKEIR